MHAWISRFQVVVCLLREVYDAETMVHYNTILLNGSEKIHRIDNDYTVAFSS